MAIFDTSAMLHAAYFPGLTCAVGRIGREVAGLTRQKCGLTSASRETCN